MATPSTPADPVDDADRTDGYLGHLARGVDAVGEAPYLVAIPLLSAMLGIGRVGSVVGTDQAFSLTLGLPTPTPDVWAFLNAAQPIGVTDGVVGTFGAAEAGAFLVGTAVRAVLGAGLLGVLAGVLGERERPAFVAAVRRFFLPVLLYEVLVLLGVLLLALLTVASGGNPVVVLVGISLGLVVLYAIYGTPFLAVAGNRDFPTAVNRSVSLAGSGPYALFTVGYALTVLACSPVVSALAYGGGIPGLVLAAVLAAPVGTVLAATATSFFLSLAE